NGRRPDHVGRRPPRIRNTVHRMRARRRGRPPLEYRRADWPPPQYSDSKDRRIPHQVPPKLNGLRPLAGAYAIRGSEGGGTGIPSSTAPRQTPRWLDTLFAVPIELAVALSEC